MIAVDTNVLVYGHRGESEHHATALARLSALAEGDVPWGLPVFCLGEFVRVVTHPRVFARPSTLEEAIAALDGFTASPAVRILTPGPRFARFFAECVLAGDARGNLAFDAQIAAVCLEHGAREILTLDRDFARFPQLSVVPVSAPGSAPGAGA